MSTEQRKEYLQGLVDEQKKYSIRTAERPFLEEHAPLIGEAAGAYAGPVGAFAGGVGGYMYQGQGPLDAVISSGTDLSTDIVGGKVLGKLGKYIPEPVKKTFEEGVESVKSYAGDAVDLAGKKARDLAEYLGGDPSGKARNEAMDTVLEQGHQLHPFEIDEISRQAMPGYREAGLETVPSQQAGGTFGRALAEGEGILANLPFGGAQMKIDLENTGSSFYRVLKDKWAHALTPERFGAKMKNIVDDFENKVFTKENTIWDEIVDKANDVPEARVDAGNILLDGPSSIDPDGYFGVEDFTESLGLSNIDLAGRLNLPKAVQASKPKTRADFNNLREIGEYLSGRRGVDEITDKGLRKQIDGGVNMPLLLDEYRRKIGQNLSGNLKKRGERDADARLNKMMYATITEAQGRFVPDRAAWESAKAAHKEGREMLRSVGPYVGDVKTGDLNKMLNNVSKDPDLASAIVKIAEQTGSKDVKDVVSESILYKILDDASVGGFRSFKNKYEKLDPTIRGMLKESGASERAFEAAAIMDRMKWANRLSQTPGGGKFRAVIPIDSEKSLIAYALSGVILPPLYRLIAKELPRVSREINVGDYTEAAITSLIKNVGRKAAAMQVNPYNEPTEAYAAESEPSRMSIQPHQGTPFTIGAE